MILCAGVGFLIGLLVFSFRSTNNTKEEVKPPVEKVAPTSES